MFFYTGKGASSACALANHLYPSNRIFYFYTHVHRRLAGLYLPDEQVLDHLPSGDARRVVQRWKVERREQAISEAEGEHERDPACGITGYNHAREEGK